MALAVQTAPEVIRLTEEVLEMWAEGWPSIYYPPIWRGGKRKEENHPQGVDVAVDHTHLEGVAGGVKPSLILYLFPKALQGEYIGTLNKFTNCFKLGPVAVTSVGKEIIQRVPKGVQDLN